MVGNTVLRGSCSSTRWATTAIRPGRRRRERGGGRPARSPSSPPTASRSTQIAAAHDAVEQDAVGKVLIDL